jgi:hypothetical protein
MPPVRVFPPYHTFVHWPLPGAMGNLQIFHGKANTRAKSCPSKFITSKARPGGFENRFVAVKSRLVGLSMW